MKESQICNMPRCTNCPLGNSVEVEYVLVNDINRWNGDGTPAQRDFVTAYGDQNKRMGLNRQLTEIPTVRDAVTKVQADECFFQDGDGNQRSAREAQEMLSREAADIKED